MQEQFKDHISPSPAPVVGRHICPSQFYCVERLPHERLAAILDPAIVPLLKRVIEGGQDCALCRTSLTLDPPDSDACPSVIGHISGVVMACCSKCARELGEAPAARKMAQTFLDECCGGGTVFITEGEV